LNLKDLFDIIFLILIFRRPLVHKRKQNDLLLKLQDKEFVQSISDEIISKLDQNEGMTLKDATGISDDALEEIYSLAYNYYNQGKYEEALALFNFLASASPSVYKYVLGLASTYHQMNSFGDAIVGFYIAMHLNPEDPTPAYYITDSFLKLNRPEDAVEYADLTIKACKDRPEYSELKERCKLIKKNIKNKISQ
jgi:type III secretion system low calcium response chaperone LcrH/SycD